MGFKADTNLVGDDYNWISSMFYFGIVQTSIDTSTNQQSDN